MKTLPWGHALPGLAVLAAAFAAHADLSDRYVIDVHKAERAYAGTTIFADHTDPDFPVIVEVDMTGKVVWSFNINIDLRVRNAAAIDVEWIPATDTILFTRPSGVYEVDRNKKIVWSHKAPASHDADRLPNGNTLFVWAWGDDSTVPEVREVDPVGNVVWKWHATDHLKNEKRHLDKEGYSHANSVVRLANGNTLVSLRNFYMLVEVAPAGNIVWKLPDLFTTPHDPEVLPNGNILVNTRGPQVIKEITPAGNVVWQYRSNQDEVNVVRYNHRLPNGNILFVERTKIVEITSQREVVWQLRLKDVGPDSSRQWLYKGERIPVGRKPAPAHAFVAPSETLAKSGERVLTSEERMKAQAERAARGMLAQMDRNGDGRIARDEFTGRAPFESIDADGDGFITAKEAEAFHMKRMARQGGGASEGGGRRGR